MSAEAIEIHRPHYETELGWQDFAKCLENSTEEFYPPEGMKGRASSNFQEKAKRICIGCEVIQICRQYALDNEERFGVWGGTTEKERNRVFAKRKRSSAPN